MRVMIDLNVFLEVVQRDRSTNRRSRRSLPRDGWRGAPKQI